MPLTVTFVDAFEVVNIINYVRDSDVDQLTNIDLAIKKEQSINRGSGG